MTRWPLHRLSDDLFQLDGMLWPRLADALVLRGACAGPAAPWRRRPAALASS